MSHFYGDITGSRGTTTTKGSTAKLGIDSHIRGWNVGVQVRGHHNEETGKDEFYVYGTYGSRNSQGELIATIKETEGVQPAVLLEQEPEQLPPERQAAETITRAALGAARRVVKLNTEPIPDLWHIAQDLANFDPGDMENVDHTSYRRRMQAASEAILECWHLAHDLKDNLLDPKLQG